MGIQFKKQTDKKKKNNKKTEPYDNSNSLPQSALVTVWQSWDLGISGLVVLRTQLFLVCPGTFPLIWQVLSIFIVSCTSSFLSVSTRVSLLYTLINSCLGVNFLPPSVLCFPIYVVYRNRVIRLKHVVCHVIPFAQKTVTSLFMKKSPSRFLRYL